MPCTRLSWCIYCKTTGPSTAFTLSTTASNYTLSLLCLQCESSRRDLEFDITNACPDLPALRHNMARFDTHGTRYTCASCEVVYVAARGTGTCKKIKFKTARAKSLSLKGICVDCVDCRQAKKLKLKDIHTYDQIYQNLLACRSAASINTGGFQSLQRCKRPPFFCLVPV